MRYVIIRDDDTNACTPAACLERLYRPFLDRGLPVNLALIPNVTTGATTPTGQPEGFLRRACAGANTTLRIGGNAALVRYLRENPGYHLLQHGYQHECFEFARQSRHELAERITQGIECLLEAGFPRPETFVAPHDRFSRPAFLEAAERFRVLSTGWFELRRLPHSWWPRYTLKKIRGTAHWQVGRTLLLSHPGCLLSCHRPLDSLIGVIIAELMRRRVTVLVTHWWEYFPAEAADERFIQLLHELADYLATERAVKVIRFRDLVEGSVPLN